MIPKLEFKTVIFNDRDFNYNLFPSYEIEDLINNNVKDELIEVQPEFTEFKNKFRITLLKMYEIK